MTLTPDQTAALTAFRQFLARPEQPVFLLRGYAGTGKNYHGHDDGALVSPAAGAYSINHCSAVG